MKRVKRLAAWAVWVGVWVGLGLSGCSPKRFERNPNLRELTRSEDANYLLSPIWTQNGIYYFYHYWCDTDTTVVNWPEGLFPAQGFLRIDPNGDGNILLMGDTNWREPNPGKFYSMAYYEPTGYIAILGVEGPVLIWNIWTDSLIDSIPNPEHYCHLIRWLPDGSGILVGSDSVWKVSLGDSNWTFYGSGSECGFEVNSDGTLYSELPWPSFCPEDSSILIYTDRCNPFGDAYALYMHTPSGEVELEANPYDMSWFYRFSSWAPNGNSIVFAGGMVGGDPVTLSPTSLWILEDVR